MPTESPVALVTGGAVRLGRALSEALAARAFRLVVHYNASAGPADELVARIRADGGEAVAVGGDLSRPGGAERLARDAVDAFGGIDVLVNSAATFAPEALEDTDEDLLDHTLAVNLRAPFLLIRHLAPTLRDRRGCVVNLADLAGLQSWARYAAHGVAKAGITHLTRVAARALAPEVRVNAIAPGAVLPPDDTSPEELERLARGAALQRLGSPRDVVKALHYLLDADFVTGQVLVVDGGRTLKS